MTQCATEWTPIPRRRVTSAARCRARGPCALDDAIRRLEAPCAIRSRAEHSRHGGNHAGPNLCAALPAAGRRRQHDVITIEQLGAEQLAPSRGTTYVPYDPSRGSAYLAALSARAAPEYRQRLADEWPTPARTSPPPESPPPDALVPTIPSRRRRRSPRSRTAGARTG